MIAASITYGCSLHCLRLQPPLPTAAASATYGCSPSYLRLQAALEAALTSRKMVTSRAGETETFLVQLDLQK